MSFKKFLSVLVTTVAGSASLLGQSERGVQSSVVFGEKARFDDGGTLSVNEFRLQAPLARPVELSSHLRVIPSLSYKSHDFDLPNTVGIDDVSAHNFQLGGLFLYQPESRWGGIARVSFGLASDFHSLNSDALYISGFAAATYEASDSLTWYFGARSGRSSGEDKVFPILGLRWKPTHDVTLDLTGPKASALWEANDTWRFSLTFWSSGGLWQLEQEGVDYELAYRSLKLAIGAEHEVFENLWLSVALGVALDNHLDLDLSNGSDVFDDGLENHGFLQVGARYTF